MGELDQLRDNLAASEGVFEVLHLTVGTPDLSPVEGKVAEALGRTGLVYPRAPW